LAGKFDAILKVSIFASVLFASTSVGYYYLIYLPRRDARFEPERALQQLRAAAQKRAEREQLLLEQQVSEQRVLEQQAEEQRQLQEKADRYQACLRQVADGYNNSRIAACNRLQEKVIKTMTTGLRRPFAKKYAIWPSSSASLCPIARFHERSKVTWTLRQKKHAIAA
jgi:hypothetical protein